MMRLISQAGLNGSETTRSGSRAGLPAPRFVALLMAGASALFGQASPPPGFADPDIASQGPTVNRGQKAPALDGKPLHEVLANNLAIVPEDVKAAVRNNGGGAHNHALFWEILAGASKGGASGTTTTGPGGVTPNTKLGNTSPSPSGAAGTAATPSTKLGTSPSTTSPSGAAGGASKPDRGAAA